MPAATAIRAKSEAPPSAPVHARRLDIEGLRAVAVVAVVLDHLFHWPHGGFVGVDIFFVISGYLISGILLREATSTGRISFRQFYIRRIKRILPAAAVVLSATVTAGYVIYYGGKATSIAWDAVWALLFSANWRFAILGTDYMNSGASVSPLQHYWSLGVEEQFYIFWPWIILAAMFVARRVRSNQRGTVLILGTAVALPILLSFVFALWETSGNHTVAYFSTLSRAWELGAGALLAVLTVSFKGFTHALRVLLLWMGLALLLSSILFITPATPFPAPYAVIPVLGSCLVILAGIGTADQRYERQAWILTNRLSRYLGKISYSLYLWHFPVIILLASVVSPDSKWFSVVAISLMAVLSVASFHFVEDPIRRSKLGRPAKVIGTHSVRGPVTRISATVPIVALVVAVVSAPLVAAAVSQQQATAPAAASVAPVSDVATVPARQQVLRSALAATDWPALQPNPAEMGPDGALAKPDEWIKDGCLGGELSPLAHSKDVVQNAAGCVYGTENATRALVVFGDSTTMSYVPGIRKAVDEKGWKIYIYTVAACSPTLVPVGEDGSAKECIRFKSWVQDEIQRIHPDLVVSSFLRNDGQLASKATGSKADAEWQRNIADMAKFVTSNGARYVLLEAPTPAKAEPSQCITRFSKPVDCITDRRAEFDSQARVSREALSSLGDRGAFVPTKEWFCVDAQCPAFLGGTALYADINHISARASEELAPLLRDALQLPPTA
ncbi:acyltransferase family protein [Pseudarthrobacter sp. PH31-O2]|uniref:acyltransferase family protein n=1 Tax=Pseudarthrobacter sp. PH31-O2 TaxID=3046206 RepID=UPI0024BBBAA2|nr:acyltransferase family protein [Pseudarthrobacter sp. PH31-O2]MDJ0351160.1 acyltransferase family protein [Pseudarthrobacter sp. PH31-O2]